MTVLCSISSLVVCFSTKTSLRCVIQDWKLIWYPSVQGNLYDFSSLGEKKDSILPHGNWKTAERFIRWFLLNCTGVTSWERVYEMVKNLRKLWRIGLGGKPGKTTISLAFRPAGCLHNSGNGVEQLQHVLPVWSWNRLQWTRKLYLPARPRRFCPWVGSEAEWVTMTVTKS